MGPRVKRLSGIQKQVLGLYRSMLRTVETKPAVRRAVARCYVKIVYLRGATKISGEEFVRCAHCWCIVCCRFWINKGWLLFAKVYQQHGAVQSRVQL